MSIFNPWGALRKARQRLSDAQFKVSLLQEEARVAAEKAHTDRKEFDLRQRILHAEIERLQELVKNGHFRNPKTGRLGRKGERFK